MKLGGEDTHQIALMDWARYTRIDGYLLSDLLIHVPNGEWRSIAGAKKLKAMGVKAGWPDLQLMIPSREHHGGFWELKYLTNKPRANQLEVHRMLRYFGYYVAWFNEWALCSQDILKYLARRTESQRNECLARQGAPAASPPPGGAPKPSRGATGRRCDGAWGTIRRAGEAVSIQPLEYSPIRTDERR